MKETERMKDEPVDIWDTFGKKTRMNFLRTVAPTDLMDFGLEPLPGLKLHRARIFAGLRISMEPEALSGSDFGNFLRMTPLRIGITCR